MIIRLVLAGFIVFSSMPSVNARDSWKFEVTNGSSVPVRHFRTKEDGQWSSNWISGDRINPGETFIMDFRTSEGNSVVRTQITFTDDTYFDYDVDYCKAEIIIIRENELLFQ